MKLFKKIGLMIGVCSLIFAEGSQLNAALAVSDKAIAIREKTKELVSSAIDYYVEEYPEGLSGLDTFVKKLNEKQLEIFKSSFSNNGFSNVGGEVSLTISVSGIDLLVAAVQSADSEFVKLVVENFYIPDINETDSCGCGSPLWCAVCLAGEEGVDSEAVKSIVDYLLSVGANPYTEYGKGYVPYLFEADSNSAPRMILKGTFEKYGYGDMFKDSNESLN